MHKFYTCLLLLLSGIGFNSYAQISFNISSPVAPYIVDSTVNLELTVSAANDVSTVTATVGGRQTALYNVPPLYYNNIYVADLPFDTLLLTLTVTDVLGNTKDTALHIIHDAPPGLVIDSLLYYGVATPTLHLKGLASDNDPIKSITFNSSAFQYALSGNTIDTVVNLLGGQVLDGSELPVWITVTDQRNQTTTRAFTVYVESSPYLERVYTSPYRGRIIDYKYNKVLIDDRDSFQHRIVDIQTKAMSAIPVHKPFLYQEAFLTPYGAFFATGQPFTPSPPANVYEFHNGAIRLQELRSATYAPKLLVAGHYAILFDPAREVYPYTDSVRVRDLSTGINWPVVNHDGYFGELLADNGLALINFGGLYAWYGGRTKRIPAADNGSLLSTDGKQFLYGIYDASTPGSLWGALYLADTGNAAHTLITPHWNGFRLTNPKVNGRYVAYVGGDSSQTNTYVYLRDSAGHVQQKSFWGKRDFVTEKIKVLDSSGNFIFAEATFVPSSSPERGYYLAGPNGSTKKVTTYSVYNTETGSDNVGEGRDVFIENGQFFIAIGNTLFRVHANETEPLPVPVIAGIATQYCSNEDAVTGRILNAPAGVTTVVTLDNVTLPADSSFTFKPDTLSPGTHQITVRFSNAADTTSTTLSFTVLPFTIPALTVTANISTINTATDTVIITAQLPVGYKNALYTFAWDASFTNVLRLESVDNTVVIPPAAFAVGNNTIYAKVLTGNTCSSSITVTDSIVINRSIVTAVGDVDVPGKMIIAYPNPFRGPVTIKGFQITKQYTLSLYDLQGKLILKKRVYHQDKTEINVQGSGNYILQINDDTKKRLLGSLQVIKI